MPSIISATTSTGLVTNADNSGVLQLSSGSGNLVTIPSVTGTAMVSGNMPAFSAYADTAQTISSGTLTKVTFGTEEFDTNNNFASSRFTPTVAGYYQFNATILCKASSTLTFAGLSFYKNGSNAVRTVNIAIASFSEPSISASCLLYLNGSTDFVEVYGSITGTGTITFGFNDSAITSRFSGCLVRAA
jgi:hypothetical protein